MATVSLTVSKTDPKYKKGVEILTYFHNASKKYPNYKFKTVDELIAAYGTKGPILAKGMGNTFIISEDPMSKAQASMEKFAALSKGRTPTWQGFTDALMDSLSSIDYWNFVSEVAVESAKKIGGGIVSAGQDIISAEQNLLKVIKWVPYIAVGIIGFALYRRVAGASPTELAGGFSKAKKYATEKAQELKKRAQTAWQK